MFFISYFLTGWFTVYQWKYLWSKHTFLISNLDNDDLEYYRSLKFFHYQLSCPWWLSLVTVTLLVRISTSPLFVKHQQVLSRWSQLSLHISYIIAKAKHDKLFLSPMNDIRRKLIENDASFYKVLIMPLTSIPIFISFAISNRVIMYQEPSFALGGALWFPNLTVPDPYWILPGLCSLSSVVGLQLASRPHASYSTNITTGSEAKSPTGISTQVKKLFSFFDTEDCINIFRFFKLGL